MFQPCRRLDREQKTVLGDPRDTRRLKNAAVVKTGVIPKAGSWPTGYSGGGTLTGGSGGPGWSFFVSSNTPFIPSWFLGPGNSLYARAKEPQPCQTATAPQLSPKKPHRDRSRPPAARMILLFAATVRQRVT